ncbi:hypothetical protein ACIQ7D_17745 [Streptomyces sp. NPDC096310]|uniref:hypothetical protein n=1 Tax=Streptomyces sp. NPDC096310 TaxID=3366082 RepID=UPI0037F660A6
MICEDRFLISRKPYAVALHSFRTDDCWSYIDAVWFRRTKTTPVACIGELRTIQRPVPANAEGFLQRYSDGRYGGDCRGRWDGTSYWGNVPLEQQERHLGILRPMLANYPAIPPGYDGWWTFQVGPR